MINTEKNLQTLPNEKKQKHGISKKIIQTVVAGTIAMTAQACGPTSQLNQPKVVELVEINNTNTLAFQRDLSSPAGEMASGSRDTAIGAFRFQGKGNALHISLNGTSANTVDSIQLSMNNVEIASIGNQELLDRGYFSAEGGTLDLNKAIEAKNPKGDLVTVSAKINGSATAGSVTKVRLGNAVSNTMTVTEVAMALSIQENKTLNIEVGQEYAILGTFGIASTNADNILVNMIQLSLIQANGVPFSSNFPSVASSSTKEYPIQNVYIFDETLQRAVTEAIPVPSLPRFAIPAFIQIPRSSEHKFSVRGTVTQAFREANFSFFIPQGGIYAVGENTGKKTSNTMSYVMNPVNVFRK